METTMFKTPLDNMKNDSPHITIYRQSAFDSPDTANLRKYAVYGKL